MNFDKPKNTEVDNSENEEVLDARKPANPIINEEMYLEHLEGDDRILVKEHEVIFDEMDRAETGDERRALWQTYKTEMSRHDFERLVEITEYLKSEQR